MSFRRAALLATIPWVLTMAAFIATEWRNLVAAYGWPDDLRRMVMIALILYGGMTWALANSRPAPRNKPPVSKHARNWIIAIAAVILFLVTFEPFNGIELPRWFWVLGTLCLAAAMLVRVWFDIVGKLTGPPPKAEWSNLAVGLLILGAWSTNVARDYQGAVGTSVLAFLGPAFMGMAFITVLLVIREAPQHAASVQEEQGI